MSAIRFVIAAIVGMLSVEAGASSAGGGYYISAPVLAAVPITSRYTIEQPVEQCRSIDYAPRSYSYREDRRRHDHAGSGLLPGLFGGVVGGLIGNQFGGGSGKTALTVIGAFAGSSIARQAAASQRREYAYRDDVPVRRCETRYESRTIEQVVGYDVTYEYAGRQFVKRTEAHPGDRIQIRVEADPVLE
jgi:uncharacterized protein YcfJ